MEIYVGDLGVRFKVTIKDEDADALDPDSQSVKLYDPSGTERDSETSPTQSAAGVYYVEVDISTSGTKGNWKLVWTVTVGTKMKQGVLEFYAGETP